MLGGNAGTFLNFHYRLGTESSTFDRILISHTIHQISQKLGCSFFFLLSVSALCTSSQLAFSPDRGHPPGATFSFHPVRSALAASFLTAPTIPASLSSRLINMSPCIHENHPDRCCPTVPPPRCLQFHTHSVESRQKEPVCEETSRQAAFPQINSFL